MNKKFSTLVATLLLSGALFTLNAEPVSDLSKVAGIEVVDATASTPKTIKFTGDATLSDGAYIEITEDNVVVDGQGKTLNGNIVVFGKNVTVKDLKVVYARANTDAMSSAIMINAEGATVQNCDFELAETEVENVWTNGLVIWPIGGEQTIKVENCSFKGFAQSVEDDESTWTGSGLLITAEAPTDKTWQKDKLGEGAESAAYSDLTISMSGNTFEGCAIDYCITEEQWESGKWTQSGYIETLITPLYKDDKLVNGGEVADAVKQALEGAEITFNGTAEEFATSTSGITDKTNITVNTKDGAVTPGVKLPEETLTIGSGATDPKVALAASYVDGEYYYLVVKTTDASKLLSTNDGKLAAEANTAVTGVSDNYLWTVKSATSNKHDHIDYVFVNKAGVELELCSANPAAYGKQGVALKVSEELGALEGLTKDEVLYFGLYRQPSHLLEKEVMNALHNGGFYISFKDVAGTDAFNGLLVAEGAANATSFVLKNEDGSYIIAKATNVAGSNVNEYVYAFELTDKVAEASSFRFWHTPINVEDNHALLTKIDSIQVYVPTKTANVKAWATLGTYGLTTDNTKTLGASLETELAPVSINLTDYTVKPEEFLKNGFAVIKQLNEDVDLFVVASTCDNKIALAESVVNDVEKQWAVSYDVEKKVYKMVNRENTAVSVEVPYTQLRENGDKEDNIYVYGGKKYEITFVPVDASSKYYKFLSEGTDKNDPDLAEKSFVMSYWSTVFNGYANVAINDKDWAFIDTKAVQAEFTATAVDTVAAKTLINYYDATKKEWQKNEPVLKAPVYEFTVGDLDFGLNKDGKFALLDDEATAMAIRVAGEHFNLAKAKDIEGKNTAKWDGKVYVGNNDSYMYSVNCLYDDNKNTLFMVADNNRPEYRRLGKTVKDGYNDMEGDLNILKFFRTNDENQFLYENTMNRNANNGAASLNFLGETNLADKPANAQLPFLVDTAYIRNETRKPLYLLSVRNEFVKGKEAVACPDHGFDPNCPHWTAGTPDHRTGAYLVTLDDSVATYAQAKYQGNIRLAFVDATHVGDSLIIASSKYTGTKTAKNDTLSFVKKDGKQRMNAATFAFKLVDRAVDPEGDKATFIIEAVPASENGPARYVRVHNTVPVLVDNIAEAATFEVMAAAEGETATSNEGIEATGVSVVATNGAVIVKGAEGKNVVITNVLGQQVANTVVSSSEASIAAPAGMVVVAVEGEAAVKAIVK
ncbi:hypothetical protein DXD68_17730 [Parabacteroides sp. TM07-1AC]|jgi:hypothetical protein|uniref:DUF6383 domain-containing protein n=1 Tax=Parabacteroides sp. TM07-1AC TaxID=2292363 RepID=UPI000EFEBD3A|nr:DUF6383 domain-containing protein [Parabacteroides sp. TM07-1AC]RHU24240.1 hypothetical protein DXD68_17730 [Parabacteroides sp. TM07-1AC]